MSDPVAAFTEIIGQWVGIRRGTQPHTRVRVRLFVEGKLDEQTWLDPVAGNVNTDVTELCTRIVRTVTQANVAGKPWLVDLHDPALPREQSSLQFGTDPKAAEHPDDDPQDSRR